MKSAEADAMQDLFEREQIKPLRIRPSVRDALRVLIQVDKRTFIGLGIASVILGILPMGFTLATAKIVEAVPAAIDAGTYDSDAGRAFIGTLILALVAYIAANVPAPFVQAFKEGFRARVNANRRERAMKATLRVSGIRHLENAEYLDALRLATTRDWPDPGSFSVAIFDITALRITGFAAAIVVGFQFNWFIAIALCATWIIAGSELRKGQAEGYASGRGELRRSQYFRNMAFDGVAAKEVRIFGLRNWVLDSFTNSWRSVMHEVWTARALSNKRITFMVLLVIIVNLVSFGLLIHSASTGAVSAGAFTAAGQALLSVAFVGMTNQSTLSVSLGSAAFPAILALEELSENSDFTMTGTGNPAGMPVREVVFENVTFTYPGSDKPVYNNLNLRLEAGKSLGIVGNNGAGKTTLIKLLTRFYEPDSGRILVDGVDLQTFDPIEWQRRVAAIFQDFVHFEYSAADNVRFGSLELATKLANEKGGDKEVLDRVTSLVGADEFVQKLPQGWETPLSRRFEGGVDLSGGQWQRLALARALYAVEGGAGILVLDEPTANLDARSEVLLFDRFLEVTKGSTSVLISHRFSTVRRADRIVVIERGSVVEEGTHDELVAIPDGAYAHAFNLQAGRYNDDPETEDLAIDLVEEDQQ